jgi:hypothetical protein
MDIKYHFVTAWKHCINNMLALVILTLVLTAVSVFSFGIMGPTASAGYVYSLLQLLKNNREPKAQDIFSQLKLFFPLLIFGILIFTITIIGFTLFIIPGILFTLIIGYTCLYVIPIMVDQNVGLFDAIKKSFTIAIDSHFTDNIIVFIIFAALTTMGASSFIGFLFLQPFVTLFTLSVYEKIK